MRKAMLAAIMLLVTGTTFAKVNGTPVEYRAGDVTLRGYLARDESFTGKRPGIIVVHEWWGHNAYVRKRAEMLAALGYVALAVDMYGDGKQATHPEDAGKFATQVMRDLPVMEGRFLAGLEYLKHQAAVDTTRIAAIGYCFGGGVVLNMARTGADLKGVVSFHGSLTAAAPAEKGTVKARILVCTGGADKFIPQKDVDAFKAEMKAAGATYRVITYPGAKHSFTNPDATAIGQEFMLPMAYNGKADRESWTEMKKFLKEVLGS